MGWIERGDTASVFPLKRARRLAAVAASTLLGAALLMAGCGDRSPYRIGFLGSLTGKYAYLGEGGRNGFLLALEEINAAGGVDGRRIEAVIRDDQHNDAKAADATRELLAQQVRAVVGPMTSAMAKAVIPVLTGTDVPLISPTATSSELEGKDDPLFRILSSDPEYALQLAGYAWQTLGVRTLAIAFEEANRSYSESLANAFRKAFEDLGGKVVLITPLDAKDATSTSERLLAASPEAILMISNPVDTARISQVVRSRNEKVRLLGDTAEERVIQLGGAAVEGLVATQTFDRDDPSPRYAAFVAAYEQRFKTKPGFEAIASYDATRVTLEGLAHRESGESLKAAIVRVARFAGVQGEIRFDRFGDAHRKAVIVRVENGQFKVIR
ncbi:ABC transporter substrate-binding protein [Niveibacterium umoris]|uniref:Branched-chain amino acid transport system substrate-binding protein n=1 Tax=Niveibacterium umoris TaxID=1193620 RepID=A0A840BF96_9RHOO|nr:ABC transporter substrate-binding protein [Niveibacterium umoris]MBB4010864.1 branched-chain amino acid transport system substrate-binding protein [Niveibacterium umoris]